MVFKKNLQFLCCCIVWIRDFIKNFCKTILFFSQKTVIFKIQNFNKIPLFTICFLFFFIIFGILYSISPMQTFPKIMEFFVVFYLKSKISTKFHHLLFLFYFIRIVGIFFSISPIQTCPKIMNFFVVFYWKG